MTASALTKVCCAVVARIVMTEVTRNTAKEAVFHQTGNYDKFVSSSEELPMQHRFYFRYLFKLAVAKASLSYLGNQVGI